MSNAAAGASLNRHDAVLVWLALPSQRWNYRGRSKAMPCVWHYDASKLADVHWQFLNSKLVSGKLSAWDRSWEVGAQMSWLLQSKQCGVASDWMTGDKQGSHGQIVGVAIVSARGGNLQTPLELVSAEHRFLQTILEGAEQ